jgi:uncharacterized protein YdeI (BOF family)
MDKTVRNANVGSQVLARSLSLIVVEEMMISGWTLENVIHDVYRFSRGENWVDVEVSATAFDPTNGQTDD